MRSSGILLPISSLPSPYGIGNLGDAAYKFVDFLVDSGQQYWQILPIGPTSFGDSPYQSFSAFACNPYFIDLDRLVGQCLLTEEEVKQAAEDNLEGTINYLDLFENRMDVLYKAVDRMDLTEDGYQKFKAENAHWLGDYALFMAIKSEYGHESFQLWPDCLRLREAQAIEETRERLAIEIVRWTAVQYLFFAQWNDLKRYANNRGIEFIGDIPIYVSPDSADLWVNGALFQVDEDKHMIAVAGCPPDAFCETGQLWGNPLYAWQHHKETGYDWWIRRLQHAGTIYDIVRIDHFRGLAGYYSIPAQHIDATLGSWEKGPGIDFIKALKERLPNLRIIAEDLGVLTPDVRELLTESGFPGMKVLQFAFDSGENSDYLPHKYERNSVVYTGTHDNTTSADWQLTTSPADVKFAKEYIGIENVTQSENQFVIALIRTAMASVCDTSIIPLADWLALGAEARINVPSTLGGNWLWRFDEEMLTSELAAFIKRYTTIYGRLI